MELQELISKLDAVDEDAVICAKRPWSGVAEAQAVEPNEDLSIPVEITNAGFAYLFEVQVAKQVMEIFGDRAPTLAEQVRLLVYYAENDAYPDWVYAQ